MVYNLYNSKILYEFNWHSSAVVMNLENYLFGLVLPELTSNLRY